MRTNMQRTMTTNLTVSSYVAAAAAEPGLLQSIEIREKTAWWMVESIEGLSKSILLLPNSERASSCCGRNNVATIQNR